MDLEPEIESLADRCVLCGLCLPHCPTFRLGGNEAESPRGRISLLLALARGQLEADDALSSHVESCLLCRSCERMCPSAVPYGRLMVAGRELLRTRGRPPGTAPEAGLLRQENWRGRAARGAVRLYRKPAVRALARHLGGKRLRQMDAALPSGPPATTPVPRFTDATGMRRGELVLFTGCTGELLEPETVSAAVRLLSALGYAVRIPDELLCCGAADLHAGATREAQSRMRRTAEALDRPGADAIITIASGCGGLLAEYDRWLGPGTSPPTARVHEITGFLGHEGLGRLTFEPPSWPIVVHEPCSLRNVLRQAGSTERLLNDAGFRTRPLPENEVCCGAAGEYMLTHPETANALRSPKVAALAAAESRCLVSANIGCALHLAAGAREAGLEVEVLHPVTLLARHLQRQD